MVDLPHAVDENTCQISYSRRKQILTFKATCKLPSRHVSDSPVVPTPSNTDDQSDDDAVIVDAEAVRREIYGEEFPVVECMGDDTSSEIGTFICGDHEMAPTDVLPTATVCSQESYVPEQSRPSDSDGTTHSSCGDEAPVRLTHSLLLKVSTAYNNREESSTKSEIISGSCHRAVRVLGLELHLVNR